MLVSLLNDLWLERRRRLGIGLAVGVAWLLLSAAAYPHLADSAWVQAAAGVFSRQAQFPLAFWVIAAACGGIPVITSLYAILEGSSLLSGAREREVMSLLLAYPLPRWKVFLSRLVFLCLVVGALSFAMTLAAGLAANWAAGISFESMLRMQPAASLFALQMGSLAMLIALLNCALWKTRMISLVILLVFYAPYLLHAAGGANWLLGLTPLFHAFGEMPLLEPSHVWQTILILGVTLVIIGLAGVRFEQMDLE